MCNRSYLHLNLYVFPDDLISLLIYVSFMKKYISVVIKGLFVPSTILDAGDLKISQTSES